LVEETQKIRLTLSPQAERYARRDAPVDVRRMAARGALPLPPLELATVLFALMHDPDSEVKSRARESLEALPDAVCSAVLSGPAHPVLLSHLAHAHHERAERMEMLALNPATDDATSAYLATLPHKRVVEIMANNQQRLLRHPEIVEALGSNPLTGRSTIDRILSFLGLDSRPGDATSKSGGLDAVFSTSEALNDEKAEAALRALLGNDTEGLARDLTEDGAEVDEKQRGNLYALVQSLSVFQKVKLARMGNKEARALLVRDRNKIVASAALRSPKLQESEVEGFARARNISDEVLRIIAASPEWTRSYQVKLGLATNPKCPQPAALKFLNYLQDRDLQSILKSKDVPAAVSTHAGRILNKKGKA